MASSATCMYAHVHLHVAICACTCTYLYKCISALPTLQGTPLSTSSAMCHVLGQLPAFPPLYEFPSFILQHVLRCLQYHVHTYL